MDKSQMMKGVLEGCILKVIEEQETYGYEIVNVLQEHGFTEVKEGTLYPLLLRLEKKGLITAQFKVSPFGPKRKYYHLTEEGKAYAEEFCQVWDEVSQSVASILRRNQDESVV